MKHFIEQVAFWKTSLRSPEEVEEMKLIYDQIVESCQHTVSKEDIHKLLEWHAQQLSLDEAFCSSPDA